MSDREEMERLTEPEGDEGGRPTGSSTARDRERQREEERFVPVIVKRSDEALRHPDDILAAAISEGLEQLHRPPLSLALSAVAAGLILGFTAMAVGVASAATLELGDFQRRFAAALVYPLGFVVCMMSGAQLFTEHTATALYPVLDRRTGAIPLARLWSIVGVGNLLGAFGSASLLWLAEPVIGARAGYLEVGRHLVEHGTLALTASSLLAGWLMALAAWLILATPPTVAQVVLIYLVTFMIGVGGLHHSIAGGVELFVALLHGAGIGAADAVHFMAVALGGNLLGGSLFVGVLNYGHIRKTRQEE